MTASNTNADGSDESTDARIDVDVTVDPPIRWVDVRVELTEAEAEQVRERMFSEGGAAASEGARRAVLADVGLLDSDGE